MALKVAVGDRFDADFDEIRLPNELCEFLLRSLGDPKFRTAIEAHGRAPSKRLQGFLFNLHFGQSPDRLILWACTDP